MNLKAKILVTGGGGFLGGVVADRLSNDYQVVCLDHGKNFPYLSKYYNKNVQLVKGDVCQKKLLSSIIKDVDAIVHLVGLAGERRCLEFPLKGMMSNVYSTYKLLDVSLKFNIKKLVFSSTYWVYSTYLRRQMPLAENSLLKTDSVYGSEKLTSEYLIKESGIPYAILRIANLYGFGSGVDSYEENFISKFILSAYRNKPLTVYGRGEQKIDVIYIDDVADLIKDIVYKMNRKNQSIRNQIFNVGSGSPVSIMEIIQIIKKIFKNKYKRDISLKFVEPPANKVWPDKWLSIKKIKKEITNFPFTTIEEGIEKTVENLK